MHAKYILCILDAFKTARGADFITGKVRTLMSKEISDCLKRMPAKTANVKAKAKRNLDLRRSRSVRNDAVVGVAEPSASSESD